MEFSITGLSPKQMNVAFNALKVAGVPYDDGNVPTPVITTPTADTAVEEPDTAETPPVQGAPAAQPPVQGPPVEAATPASLVDGRSCPWDERIHAKSKTCKADGSWKSTTTKHLEEQGLTKDAVKVLEAELIQKELQNIPACLDNRVDVTSPDNQLPPAGYPQQPPAQQGAPAGYPPQQPPVQGAPPAGYPPQQPPAADMVQPNQYPPTTTPAAPTSVHDLIGIAINSQCRVDIPHDVMMNQVNTALADPANMVTATDIPTICAAFGIASLPDSINNAEMTGKLYYILGGQ